MLQKKPRCWNHQSGCCWVELSLCLLLSCTLFLSLSLFICYPFVLIPSIFLLCLLSSYLISSLLCFFICIFCVIASLDRHVQSHHGHHKPFKCKLCPFKSAYVSRLKSHLHKAHTGKSRHNAYIKSHLTAVSMTNKVFPGQHSSLLFSIIHIKVLCLI